MPGRAGPACPSCSSPTWLQRTFCATSPKPPRGPSPNVIAAPSTEALRSDGNEPATSGAGSRRRGKACNASPTSTIGWRSAPDLNDPPGLAAQAIIAEIGVDMSRFPTTGHLCAWAGVAPASYESAGKRRPAGTRHGSAWLKRVLLEVARAASRTKGSYFSAQYSRIARRRGPNKAAVAVANSILAAIWHVLTNGCVYEDPGADYLERRHDPAVEAKRLQARIEALGFDVTVIPKAA